MTYSLLPERIVHQPVELEKESIEYVDHIVPLQFEEVYSLNDFVVPDLISESNITCLIQNAYFEARNQTDEAIIGVIMVVLNRVDSDNYPSNVCDVIHQGYTDSKGNMIRDMCQFSWYCDGKPDHMYDRYSFLHMEGLVYKSLWLWYNGVDITNRSTHYHSNSVKPDWGNKLTYTMHIGDHIFYKN